MYYAGIDYQPPSPRCFGEPGKRCSVVSGIDEDRKLGQSNGNMFWKQNINQDERNATMEGNHLAI